MIGIFDEIVEFFIVFVSPEQELNTASRNYNMGRIWTKYDIPYHGEFLWPSCGAYTENIMREFPNRTGCGIP